MLSAPGVPTGLGLVLPGLADAERLDLAVYAAIAATPSPALDSAMGRLTLAPDQSKLSLAAAAALAVFGGPNGRLAATGGLAAVGVTATMVNVGLKLVARRRRPHPVTALVPITRQVKMSVTRSFPSGHSAAAFAFATRVGRVLPGAAIPVCALASVVAHSRVHTGVHYPGDVIAGALVGVSLAALTGRALRRRMRAEPARGHAGPARVSSSTALRPGSGCPSTAEIWLRSLGSHGRRNTQGAIACTSARTTPST